MEPKILNADQIVFLKALARQSNFKKLFYLTGGTPLAAFYLYHRYSEDLDFFSEQEVDIVSLDTFIRGLRAKLGIKKVDFQQSFNRNLFFLHFKTGVLKTEFTYFPFPRIERGTPQFGLSVDSLLDIAVNKLFTIYQRTQARDYIDLYCICRKTGYSVPELIKKAKLKFDWHIDPLQLGTQFVKAEDAPDLPRMIEKVAQPEWTSFFLQEAAELKLEILE